MTVAEVIQKEVKKLSENDAHLHIEACTRIYMELSAIMGFPDDPKDMLTLYVAYLTAKRQSWSVGVKKKLAGYWKAYRIKIILRQAIRDVLKNNYASGDLLIKEIAMKIEKWL